ncbi:MAG: hypothetical protein HY582_03395 [Candidatus Omnitrophica bacterium]|nr:hypothetical protein [Candidatus Omnitrophota bacterium]
MSLERPVADSSGDYSKLPPLGPPPKFFSLAFHKDFFPAILWRLHLRRKKQREEYSSPFANHVHLEIPIAIVFCITLLVMGLPTLITKHSLAGGAMAVLGSAGLIAMFISSLRSEKIARAEAGGGYSFDYFVAPMFFFFILMGVTAGLSVGFIRNSEWLAIIGSLTGLITGYMVGVFAGIWINYLGWIGAYVVYLVFAAMTAMGILDVILIYGLFFK